MINKLDVVYFFLGGAKHVARDVRYEWNGKKIRVLEYGPIEPQSGPPITSGNSQYVRDKLGLAILNGRRPRDAAR